MTNNGSQRQHNKLSVLKQISLSRQGNPSNAIFYSTHTLKDKPRYTGLHPLILLGPNTPYEVSYVLKVVRFYRKLMVRNVTTKIMLPRRSSHYWGCWMGCTIDINRISLWRPIHIINSVDKTKLSCNTPTEAAPQFL